MTRSERVRYEMLQRVRDFGATHGDRFPPSSNAARLFAAIARVVSEMERHAVHRVVTLRDGQRARMDRRRVIVSRMRTIARSSREIQTENGMPLRLRMPRKTSDTALLIASRAFLQEVQPYQDQLVGLGLPAGYLTELGDTADAFDEALKARRAGRSGVAVAQAGITAGLAEGAELVRTLHVIVMNVFEEDPAVMAGWERDRRVVAWRRAMGTTESRRAPDDAGATASEPTAA